MKYEKYQNGLGMKCVRYSYETTQKYLPKENQIIEYDTMEVEYDNDRNIFGICFTYIFYILKGKIVYSEIQ